MYFYAVAKPLELATNRLDKWLPGTPDLKSVPIEHLMVTAPGEVQYVQKHLQEKSAEGGTNLADALAIVDEARVGSWPHFPPRLGRHSLGVVGPGIAQRHRHEPEVLSQQLQWLRQRTAHKAHVRIAIVNGFGSNLGDNLMGVTALRKVVQFMRGVFPSLAIDMIMGMNCSPAVVELLRIVPEVDQIVFSAPTLADFARYDAHYDFSNLLGSPRYQELPAVDFYLWWMGLDPQAVPASEKRNHIHIPYTAWHEVAGMLKPVSDRSVLLCHTASVPLRSMPLAVARQLVQRWLDEQPDWTLVVDYTLQMQHPRLLDLDGQVNSVDKLKALIAQVDALISVDSFAQHIADACATPTVLLTTSIPTTHFPYYPHSVGVVPPGMQTLPAWGRTKTDAEEWASMAEAYGQAWMALDTRSTAAQLNQLIEQRSQRLHESPAHIHFQLPAKRTGVEVRTLENGLHRIAFRHEIENPAWTEIQQRIEHLAQQFLHRGSHVIQAGVGNGKLSLSLLAMIGPEGMLAAWEPRRPYFQAFCANALLTGHEGVFAYPALPVALAQDAQAPEFVDLDLRSSHEARLAGNSKRRVRCTTQPIDSLGWNACRLLLVQPPMPLRETLQGAQQLLRTARPYVLLAPCKQDQLLPLFALLQEFDYNLWAFDQLPAVPEGVPAVLLLATPMERAVSLQGFKRVTATPGLSLTDTTQGDEK